MTGALKGYKGAELIGQRLIDILLRQKGHNRLVKTREQRTHEEWIQHYALGTIGEVSELLQEINWKVHTPAKVDWDSVGVLLELADITKYVLSLWLHLGCNTEDILTWLEVKGEIVEHRFAHDWAEPPTGKFIVISDLDGSIADWRTGFATWAQLTGMVTPPNGAKSLNMDLDAGWTFGEYAEAKKQYEYMGGHLTMPPFKDGVEFVREMQDRGALLYVVTARPKRPARMFYDTYQWLKEQQLAPEWVYFVENQRIGMAIELHKRNDVLAIEDNPDLASRYLANGIPVLMRSFDYNKALSADNLLIRSDNFTKDLFSGHVRLNAHVPKRSRASEPSKTKV